MGIIYFPNMTRPLRVDPCLFWNLKLLPSSNYSSETTTRLALDTLNTRRHLSLGNSELRLVQSQIYSQARRISESKHNPEWNDESHWHNLRVFVPRLLFLVLSNHRFKKFTFWFSSFPRFCSILDCKKMIQLQGPSLNLATLVFQHFLLQIYQSFYPCFHHNYLTSLHVWWFIMMVILEIVHKRQYLLFAA